MDNKSLQASKTGPSKGDQGANGITPIPIYLRMKKRWIIAVTRFGWETQKMDNIFVEGTHQKLLNAAKRHFTGTQQMVFERDYRHDNTESALLMHALMSKNLYFTLSCDMSGYYNIEVAFSNFQLEAEFRASLLKLGKAAVEIRLKPDFDTFYSDVLKVQRQQFIYSL